MIQALPVLTARQMRSADGLTIERGTPGIELMEEAGLAVAEVIRERFDPVPTLVLCGPGNNGGDGFVVARHLESLGWPVRVASLRKPDELTGDAGTAAGRWHATSQQDDVEDLQSLELAGEALIVDALFGTGLERALEAPFDTLIERVNESEALVVSVDIPSGIDSDRGEIMGAAVEADLTISLAAPKRGQVLMPGRIYCGEMEVVDIGIPRATLLEVVPQEDLPIVINSPDLWLDHFPWPDPMGHKYSRGHLLVVSGPALATGASRMAATAGLRVGAGLVTLAGSPKALREHAAHVTAIMMKEAAGPQALAEVLEDGRKNAVVIGPGCGLGAETRKMVKAVLDAGRAVVLDADALMAFEDAPEKLFRAITSPTVLTPHEGEFARLFEAVDEAHDRLSRARAAARRSNSIVVLKGPDTIVAAPEGPVAIATNAPPWLATAGSGDVLAGLIGGLLAQGMAPFEAACAGVWLHGEAANELGLGLIAEDLPLVLPDVLSDLLMGDVSP